MKVFSAVGGGMFLLGATLALGLAFTAEKISSAMIKMKQDNVIRVKGFAEEKCTSDMGTWSTTVTVRADTLASAYELIEKSRFAVMDFLKGNGFHEKEIAVLPVSIDIKYKSDGKGNRTNSIELYELDQTVRVESENVQAIGKVSREITNLIKDGLEITSRSPFYVIQNQNLEKLKAHLLAKATADAYSRASILASNSNGRVGMLSSASQGVFQITTPNSTDVDSYGRYDTTTVEKKITAVVTLEYTIEE